MSWGKRISLRSILFATLIPLTSCGPGGIGGPNDSALMESAGFSGVVNYPLLMTPIDYNDPVVIAFEAANEVSFAPASNAAPWAIYMIGGQGYQEGAVVNVPLGERTISKRSEVRSWKEGAVDHFAETLTYSITPNGPLKKLGLIATSPFSVRLTAQNDPAVGHWEVTSQVFDSKDVLSSEEKASVNQGLIQIGQQHVQQFNQDRAHAKYQASTQIAANLAAQGILENDKNSFLVSFSRNNGLAYYIGPSFLLAPSFNQLRAFCAGLKTPGYSGWRLGSLDELKALQRNDDSHTFIDAPDHRLLGALARETGQQTSAIIMTGTTEQETVYGALYNPMSGPPAPSSTENLEGMRIGPRGETQQTPFRLPVGSERDSAPINMQGFTAPRTFCVAPLHH